MQMALPIGLGAESNFYPIFSRPVPAFKLEPGKHFLLKTQIDQRKRGGAMPKKLSQQSATQNQPSPSTSTIITFNVWLHQRRNPLSQPQYCQSVSSATPPSSVCRLGTPSPLIATPKSMRSHTSTIVSSFTNKSRSIISPQPIHHFLADPIA